MQSAYFINHGGSPCFFLDPATPLAIGCALRPLRKEGVLIVGSGQIYHNMRGFMGGSGSAGPAAEAFDASLRPASRSPASASDNPSKETFHDQASRRRDQPAR